MIGIYKILSPSGRVYIGQSWNIKNRFQSYGSQHIRRQPKLFASLKKYGKAAHLFEIIHELPKDISQRELDRYESFYIDQHIDCGFEMLNIKGGGSRGKMPKESMDKTVATKKAKGIRSGMLGKTHSEATKRKMSEAAKGKPKSESMKEKNRLRMLGTTISDETRSKLVLSHIGKISRPAGFRHSEETKLKLKAKRSYRIISDETRKKTSESLKAAYASGKR